MTIVISFYIVSRYIHDCHVVQAPRLAADGLISGMDALQSDHGTRMPHGIRSKTSSSRLLRHRHGRQADPRHFRFRILCPTCMRRCDTLIPRYTRPDMGRIWSEENRFRTWLAVEVAATETLAEAGIVPKAAAKAIRERADFQVERIHEIEAEVRHDVIAFTTAVAEFVGPRVALVSLRADFQRCGRYRAGAADRAGFGNHRRRSGAACRGPRAPRLGIQRHADGRPHARHPCRADHVSDSSWPTGIPKRSATSRASLPPRRICGWASFPARSEPSRI